MSEHKNQDKPEWGKRYDRVIVVTDVGAGYAKVVTGHICSSPHSHASCDNVDSVVIWGDEPFTKNKDCWSDDAYEKKFSTSDPHLFRLDDEELWKFQSVSELEKHFYGIYSIEDDKMLRICAALGWAVARSLKRSLEPSSE